MIRKKTILICIFLCLLSHFTAFSRLDGASVQFIDSLLTLVKSERAERPASQREAQIKLANAYERHGEFDKADACYQAVLRLDSIILSNLIQQSTKNTERIYQLTDAKERNETLKNEQFRLYACIPIGFLIVLVFWQRYKNAKTQKKLLEMQLETSEKTLELKELEQHKLQHTVDAQQEDLKNLAVDITRKNEFLTDLEQKIQSLNTKENVQDLETLIRQNAISNEQNIIEFRGQVEMLNSIFYERLRQRTPDLSPTELEICGLIRLNLSSKEIASIRNIEPKSVDMCRYRLRQKLDLKHGEDLTTVLKSI